MSSNKIYNSIISPRGDEINYKEFENMRGYYLKLSYDLDHITIIIYNTKILDGIKYEINFNKETFDRMSNIFKNLEIREIFNKLIDILNEDNYKIKQSGNDLLLILISKDKKGNEKKLEFSLIKNCEVNEYMKILSNEIKKLKNNGNIINELIEENQNIKNEIKSLKNIIYQNNLNNYNSNYNTYN